MFADKLNEDIRQPVYTFESPFSADEYGILLPSASFWIQMSALLAMQSILCITIAAVIYLFIIQKRGTVTAFLMGYGFVIPFVVWMPYYLIRALDLRNMCLMISVATTPILVVFRCMEAMYGYSPPAVESKLLYYMVYYSSVIELEFDPKTTHPIQASHNDKLTTGKQFLGSYFLLSIFYSILEPCSYALFDSPIERASHGQQLTVLDFIHPGHLANNFIVAYLTHTCLKVGTSGFGLAISALSGIKTMTVTNNPMFGCTSPSDFWGRRWNRLVHGVLKRGVFKPVRAYFPTFVALAVTFLASGLLHEYVLYVITLKNDNETSFSPMHGSHVAFFAWNGIIMLLEYATCYTKPIQWMKTNLPTPIVTLLVLLTVLPVAHWFTHEYMASGFYSQFRIGFPLIVRTTIHQ